MGAIGVTIIDEKTPRARFGLLLKHFSELRDERALAGDIPAQRGTAIGDIVTIASCDDFDDIVAWVSMANS